MTEYTTISSSIADAYLDRLRAVQAIEAMPGDCADDDPLWSVIATAEEAIRAGKPRNRDDIAAKLWIALSYIADIDNATVTAAHNRHLGFFDEAFARAAHQPPRSDQWAIALIVSALRGLQAIPKRMTFTLDGEHDMQTTATPHRQAVAAETYRARWLAGMERLAELDHAYQIERKALADKYGDDWARQCTTPAVPIDQQEALEAASNAWNDQQLAMLAIPAPDQAALRWKLAVLLSPENNSEGGVAAWAEHVVAQTRVDIERLLPA